MSTDLNTILLWIYFGIYFTGISLMLTGVVMITSTPALRKTKLVTPAMVKAHYRTVSIAIVTGVSLFGLAQIFRLVIT